MFPTVLCLSHFAHSYQLPVPVVSEFAIHVLFCLCASLPQWLLLPWSPVSLLFLFLVECVSVAQSCLTLCDPMDCSPPDSSVHGILQARILEWVAIISSRVSSQPRLGSQDQGLNPGLLHCRQILYHLSHQGSPSLRNWNFYHSLLFMWLTKG